MRVKPSPLNIVDFIVLNTEYNFIPPDEEINIQEHFLSYNFDFDYAIKPNGAFYQIFVKSTINGSPEPKFGYSISAEGVGIFGLKSDRITEEEQKQYISYTALVITINYLRNYVASITSYGPFGKYVFPSLDMDNLLQQKNSQIKLLRKGSKQKKKEAVK